MGGEPSVDPSCIRIMRNLVESGASRKIELSITTNAIVFTDEFFRLMKSFVNLHLQVSIDGTNETFNYIRTPGNYSSVQKNLENLVEQSTICFGVNVVLSAFNVFTVGNWLTDFKNLKQKFAGRLQHFSIFPCIASTDVFTLSVLNNAERKFVLNELNQLRMEGNFSESEIEELINPVWKLINAVEFSSIERAKFVKYSQILDRIRGTSIQILHPRYADMMQDSQQPPTTLDSKTC